MPAPLNPQYGAAVGIAGYAGYWGIPRGTTIAYIHAGITRTLTVFKAIDKGNNADISESHGNNGEWLAARYRNKRIEVRISAIPKGNKETDALAIAADPPFPNDLHSIVSTDDSQLNHPVNGAVYYFRQTGKCDTSYTPEGEAVFSFDVIMYIDDNGVPIPLVTLADQ